MTTFKCFSQFFINRKEKSDFHTAMEENEKEYCHICFKQPENDLFDFEPYEDLVRNITQIKTDVSLILNKICESCASEIIAIDCFRSKFIDANQKWKKMIKSDFQPDSKNRCEECGRKGEISVDLQTWKRVCSACATDGSLPMELLGEEEIKQEIPLDLENMLIQTMEFPEQTFPKVEKKEEEDAFFQVTLLEDILEYPPNDLPLDDRLKGDDFEWPLEEENIFTEKVLLKKNIAAPRRFKNGRLKKTMPKPKIEKETTEPIARCETCKRNFFLQSEWELHVETGHDNTCKYCGYTNKEYSHVKNHLLTHLPHLWPNLCDFCGAKFAQNAAFRFHHATHIPEMSVYQCHFCSISYPRKVYLRDHIVKRHLRIRNYQCKYCPKSYLGGVDRDRHEYIHTGNWPVRCSICSKGFPRKREMLKHMSTHE